MTFSNEIADLARDVETAFDHGSFTATPMKKPDHGDPVPDPDRAGFDFKGRFDAVAKEVAAPIGNSVRPASLTRRSTGQVMVTAHTGDWPTTLKKGDRIVAANGDKYSVAFVSDDGDRHVALTLTRATQ